MMQEVVQQAVCRSCVSPPWLETCRELGEEVAMSIPERLAREPVLPVLPLGEEAPWCSIASQGQ